MKNALSDAITNHDFSGFCPERGVCIKLDDLPLDIFLRMVHSREAFLNARVSLQRLVSKESAMSPGREKEGGFQVICYRHVNMWSSGDFQLTAFRLTHRVKRLSSTSASSHVNRH